jgi:lipopolysaccharide/colanic/teichoic acid biosynthesis glycosyltransferase
MVAGAEARRDELLGLNEQDGPAFKIRHDPRVTRVGKFLRKTSLDELPQLVNVLTGDMTLVGPRPLPLAESDGCDRWHRRRLDVTPGLTCVWQVEGRNEVLFDDWMRMDLKYIRSRGVWTDLWLILRTIPAVLLRKGAR